MDDQYSMIEQNIESLLDDSIQYDVTPMERTFPITMTRQENFLPYKCLEVAAKEAPILGQYMKWSTVESDELNIQRDIQTEQLVPHATQAYNYFTVEMIVQNVLLNLWNAQLTRPNIPLTKRTCAFCRKSGKSFAIYSSHSLRINGVLHCPYLLKYRCNYCLKNGHTTGYCPMKDRNTTTTANGFFFQNKSAVNPNTGLLNQFKFSL